MRAARGTQVEESLELRPGGGPPIKLSQTAQFLKKVKNGISYSIKSPGHKEKLAVLRSKDTSRASFRVTMKELGKLLSYEVLRDFVTDQKDVDTPLARLKTFVSDFRLLFQYSCWKYTNGGILDLIPNAKCGHLGIYRDKFINNTVDITLGFQKKPIISLSLF